MDILRDVPWEAYSLNEDLEYGLLQLIKGNPTVFAPEAVVLATMPSNPVNAQSQRARWEGGRLPLLRKFVPHLLKEAVKQRRLSLIDALIDLVIPALVNILVVALLMAIVTLLLGALGFSGIYWFSLGWILVFLIGISHLIVGIAASGDADLWRLLKHVPRYVIWKLALYLKLVSKGRITEWVRTTREPEGPVPGQQEKDVESRAGLG
jgi:cellulose synthase/poly-beta-1,6-N-acetylglucosamine synthase-like glycosyltransferase